MSWALVVVSVAVSSLPQIRVEFPAGAEAPESECLRAEELLPAELAPLPPLEVVEAVNPPEELRAAEIPQQQLRGYLTQLLVPSRNTMPGVAGK